MAGFDTTNVAAQGQPINPLQNLGNVADTINALNQNKFFQAKTLAGQYLAQSLGPDGKPDLGKFSQSLQSDPRTSVFAPEIIQAAQTISQTGAGAKQLAVNLAQSQRNNLFNDIATAGVASKASDPDAQLIENKRNVATAVAAGVNSGRYTSDMATQILGDGSNFNNVVRQAVISGEGGPGSQEALTGTPVQTQTGAGNVTNLVNPYTGSSSSVTGPGGNIPNALGPKDLSAPVETLDDQGNKQLGVLGDFIGNDGKWKNGTPRPLTALSPLSATAGASLGSNYGNQISNFEQLAGNAPQQKRLLEIMRQDSNDFDAGPNTPFWTNLGEFAQEYHVQVPKWDKTKPNQVAAVEVFNKLLPNLISAQASLLHMNETDTSRSVSAASLPSTATSPQGRKKMIDILESNSDMIGAMGQAWQGQKNKLGAAAPATWGQLQMEFPRKVPPSIFQAQYMSPTEKADMMKGWSQSRIQDWEKRYNIAKDQGWLPNAQ